MLLRPGSQFRFPVVHRVATASVRRRAWLFAAALGLGCGTFGAPSTFAQNPGIAKPSGVVQPVSSDVATDMHMSAEQRDALYANLKREVAEFERQHNILKTVVKLVSPTVVHIEAEVRETGKQFGKRTVQEAGSGVVVELKKQFYVLTNRHVIKDAKLANIKLRLADGRVINPVKVWSDPDTDIAVMAISAPFILPRQTRRQRSR